MKKEIKSLLTKSAKISGVTCVAAGAVAVMTSGAAIKAMVEGGKYLANSVKRIIDEKEQTLEVPEEILTEPDTDDVSSEEAAMSSK